MNGTDIIFKIDQETFAGQTSADLSIETDMIETTNKTTGQFKTFIPGKTGSTIDVEAIYNIAETAGGSEAFETIKAKTLVELYFGCEDSGSKHYEASGYITSLSISAGDNDNATNSVSIQITGEPMLEENT